MPRPPYYLLSLCIALILSACGGSSMAAESPKSGGMSEATAAGPAAPPSPPPPAMAPQADAAPSRAEVYAVEASAPSGGDAILADAKPRRARTLEASPAPAPPPPPPPPPPGPGKKVQGGKDTPQLGTSGAEIAANRGPMLIYTANVTMAVFEVARSLADVEDLARDVGGFMARRDDHSITIRVPVGRFDEALKRLTKLGDVLHRDVTAEDVTEEFHDLEVRLKNLRAVRDRLEQLLQKATKVEDSLLIERELNRVAAEIDRIEGRMKFLRDRAAYSTITVQFQPRSSESIAKTPFQLPVPWLNELGLRRLLSL